MWAEFVGSCSERFFSGCSSDFPSPQKPTFDIWFDLICFFMEHVPWLEKLGNHSTTLSTLNKGSKDGPVVPLVPPISADPGSCVGWVSADLNLTARVFLRRGTPVFLPSAKSTPSLFHLAMVLCSEVIHGSCSGAERPAGNTAPSGRSC